MIRVRWRDVFGVWHQRPYRDRASALAFIEDCANDPAVAAVCVLTRISDPAFWSRVDDVMGFVGRDL